MIKETKLLHELKGIVLMVDSGEGKTIDDPEIFIDYYYQVEEALEAIKGKLFDWSSKKVGKTPKGLLIEELKEVMEEREQALLTFYDWGNPVALLKEKAATLARLKQALMTVPL